LLYFNQKLHYQKSTPLQVMRLIVLECQAKQTC